MKDEDFCKRSLKKIFFFALTVCLMLTMLAVSTSAQKITGIIDTLKESSEAFEQSEDIRYSYDNTTNVLSMYAIIDDYIADTVYILIEPDGRWEILKDAYQPKALTLDDARLIINRRLWLYKADKYDNTYMLDFTATPIKDVDGTEWYPLLDEFSTQSRFTSYLKEIFTDNIASNYITDTSIRIFGSELYDIGGKVSMYSFHYEDYRLEQTFAADNGGWYTYKITVPMGEDIGDLTYTVGMYYTENGWKICYDGFKDVSEISYLEKAEKGISIGNDDDNPSTCDISLIYPALALISVAGIMIGVKKK